MSYIFEEVGDNRELWTEIGFRDWNLEYIFFSKRHLWCADRERELFLYPVGSFRNETPNFYDLSYKHRIIRMEVEERGEPAETLGNNVFFSINKITVPNSVWNELHDILKVIEEGVHVYGSSLKYVANVSVKINCEPEQVEVDYNGR